MKLRMNSMRTLLFTVGFAAALGACGNAVRPTGSHGSTSPAADTAEIGTAQVAATKHRRGAAPDLMPVSVLRGRDLTPDQGARLASLRVERLNLWAALHTAIAAMGPQVEAELAKPSPDATVIHGLVDQALSQHASMTHAITDEMLAIARTMSDAQRAPLVARQGQPFGAEDANASAEASKRLVGGPLAPPRLSPTPPGAKDLSPDRMVLGALARAAMTPEQGLELRAARKQLEAERRHLARTLERSTRSLAMELQKPVLDAAAVYARVDETLAGYARLAHHAADLALAIRAQDFGPDTRASAK